MRRFPSLQTLKIEYLPRLERFSRDNERELLPNLTKLTVSDCYKLSSLPLSLVSHRKLDTWHCNEDLLDSVSYLSTLTSHVLGYLGDPFRLGCCKTLLLFKNHKFYIFGSLKC